MKYYKATWVTWSMLITLLSVLSISAADGKTALILRAASDIHSQLTSYLHTVNEDFLSESYQVEPRDFRDLTIGKYFREVFLREGETVEESGDYRALLTLTGTPVGLLRVREINGRFTIVGPPAFCHSTQQW